MTDLGVRLQLMIGPTQPRPAPYAVVDALTSLEARNSDSGRDGFQMTFSLSKEILTDYNLLREGHFDPPARVIIVVFMRGQRQVLIDGIITNHQLSPSDQPGGSKLVVTGEDISLKLDLEEKNHNFPDRTDSQIVNEILQRYVASLGLTLKITPTDNAPNQNERITTFQGTDLAFITELARRNSFVFHIKTTDAPLANIAYWGREERLGAPQPALSLNMGPETNVESLSFGFNALGPATPEVTILDKNSKTAIPVPIPRGNRPPLALRQATSLRRTLPRNTANKEVADAAIEALSLASSTSDAITGSGQLDVVRYGQPLRARALVGVRGVGLNYNGLYYVKQVTHNIKAGEYKQSFSLTREGHVATIPILRVRA